MTNKFVVIINSLQVPKIKKILLYEMKFLVPNYSCLQTPWPGGYAPRSPFSLSSVLNWICWTPPKKNPGYATEYYPAIYTYASEAPLRCTFTEQNYIFLISQKLHFQSDHTSYGRFKSWSSSLCNFLHPPVSFSLLGPNVLPSALFSKTLNLCSCPRLEILWNQRPNNQHSGRQNTFSFSSA